MYLCSQDGGCQVRYAGPAQDGSTSGSCFSQAFGGQCFGTPNGCRPCNQAIECKPKGAGLNQEVPEGPGLEKYCRISGSHTVCQYAPGVVSDSCGSLITNTLTQQ